MKDISATAAAREFSDVLDEVERNKESFVITRRGKAVARLVPMEQRANGKAVRDFLLANPPDAKFAKDVLWARELPFEESHWHDS